MEAVLLFKSFKCLSQLRYSMTNLKCSDCSCPLEPRNTHSLHCLILLADVTVESFQAVIRYNLFLKLFFLYKYIFIFKCLLLCVNIPSLSLVKLTRQQPLIESDSRSVTKICKICLCYYSKEQGTKQDVEKKSAVVDYNRL